MKKIGWLWFLILGMSTASSVNSATKHLRATTHHIGECYNGGVIIHVNDEALAPADQHGLIAALIDVPKSFEWDTQADNKSSVQTKSALFTGKANSTTTVSILGANRARAADATLHFTDGTYHDWYLPSKDELSMMYWQPMTKGGEKFWTACKGSAPSGATYWSSTQNDAVKAWGLSFAGGVVVFADKKSPLLVRAIRSF